MDFSSIRNYHEQAVYRAVTRHASSMVGVAGRQDLLLDAACVALNRLPAKYIRHEADFTFFLGEAERAALETSVDEAVQYALAFVQERAQARGKG